MSDEHLGDAIREARERRGWSQEFLAAKVGATQSTIDRIESGATRKSRVLPEIAEALDLSLPGFEKREHVTNPVGEFVKVNYVLPQDLVNFIVKYKNIIGVPSEDEVIRRIISDFMMKRDSITGIVTNLLQKFKLMRSMREAAGIVLANHPLVKTMSFNDGGVNFELEDGFKANVSAQGEVYIKNRYDNFHMYHKTDAPEWADGLNITDDWARVDEGMPF